MTCSEPSSLLPTFLKDNFDAIPDKANWAQINGATVSNKCGVLASGTSLHFKGVSLKKFKILSPLSLFHSCCLIFMMHLMCMMYIHDVLNIPVLDIHDVLYIYIHDVLYIYVVLDIHDVFNIHVLDIHVLDIHDVPNIHDVLNIHVLNIHDVLNIHVLDIHGVLDSYS